MSRTQKIIVLYLLLIPVFFGIDIAWLGVVASNFYNDQIGFLLADRVNWTAASFFYLLYIVSILYFAVLPGLKEGSVLRSGMNGAFLGFIAYATYDLTNLATLNGWPIAIVAVDMLWGTILTATVALAGWKIGINLLEIKS